MTSNDLLNNAFAMMNGNAPPPPMMTSTTSTTTPSKASKVYFHKRGDTYKLAPKVSLDLHEKLPVGTYAVAVDPCDGSYFLQTIEPFTIQHKIYGDTTRQADRILRTFLDRNSSTGVLLVGEKGAGKTLLAKHISISGATPSTTDDDGGIPTIVVNQPHVGEKFNQFLQRIEQPKIVLFDEFEKVYKDQQQHLLTLLDGTYPSKTLFLLTCNDKFGVNSHMMNRPGRIYYLLEFKGISQAFIREYCQDNLDRKEHIPALCAVASLFLSFNFDMLKAMVEEMNRYGETPGQVIRYLNARPDFGGVKQYTQTLTMPGKNIMTKGNWRGTPLSSVVSIHYVEIPPQEEEEDDEEKDEQNKKKQQQQHRRRVVPNRNLYHQYPQQKIQFNPRHLQMFDSTKGEYTFYDKEKEATLVLQELKTLKFHLDYSKIGLHKTTTGGRDSPTATDDGSTTSENNDDLALVPVEAMNEYQYGDY